MATTVEEAMSQWGRAFLREEGREVNDDAVIDFEDDTYESGYCETCYYSEYIVRVSTSDTPDGSFVQETFWGSMPLGS